jgi:hypothetical protein
MEAGQASRRVIAPRNNRAPPLIEHAGHPQLGKAECFSTTRTAFREQYLSVDEDANFPVTWPSHESASRLMVQPPHGPERTDIVRCVLF